MLILPVEVLSLFRLILTRHQLITQLVHLRVLLLNKLVLPPCSRLCMQILPRFVLLVFQLLRKDFLSLLVLQYLQLQLLLLLLFQRETLLMRINRFLQPDSVHVDGFLMDGHVVLLLVERVIMDQSLFQECAQAEALISIG